LAFSRLPTLLFGLIARRSAQHHSMSFAAMSRSMIDPDRLQIALGRFSI
jgi:hypothetical protein